MALPHDVPRWRLPGSSLKAMLSWSLGCLLAALLTWGVVLSTIEKDRAATEKAAFALATSLSKSYSEQLARTIEQIEHITLDLRYDWEATNRRIDLEDQYRKGLYPSSSHLYVTIVDRKGKSITSTLGGAPVQLEDRKYFQHHRSSLSDELRVDSEILVGRRSGKSVIRFTRRLAAADGTFDGVVMVGVEPEYLASFNDEDSLGPHDLISIRHENGNLLVSEKGKRIQGQGQVHKEPPTFPSDVGIMRVSADRYTDEQARIVAWHKLPDYPLTSYVGLAESGLFAAHLKTANSYRGFAIGATLLLIFIALGGIFFTSNLAWRKRQAEEIRNTFHLAIDAAREGFYMVRALYGSNGVPDFVVEDCNERGAALLGLTKKTLIGKKLSSIDLGDPGLNFTSASRLAMTQGYYEDEFTLNSEHGKLDIWLHRRMVRAGSGLAITLRDISEAKLNEHRLVDIASKDALTGLPNRHALLSFLPEALQAAASADALLAVFYIDLDGFKSVNDTLGHQAGDLLLQEAANRLKSVLRPVDYVVRLGGDEFTIVLPRAANREEVAQIAQRISRVFHKPFEIQGRSSMVGTSIGISLFPEDGNTTEILLQKADIAMYAAKDEGKGKYRFYGQQLYERIKTRLDMEQELERAIEEDQFVMHYQPRVDAQSGELTGLEALVRWAHPEKGMICPDDFIPLSEKNGMIARIGERVLHQVCAQIASWREREERTVPVSINISASQFNAGGVEESLATALKQYDIAPSMIEIELTESAMMNESADVLSQVSAISRMGIRIHVDDFGTGYSSLSRLQEFRMNCLKIDRVFTSKLGTGKESGILFETIVLMAQALQMKVIAEGVETEDQLQIARSLACDEVQGYLVSPPVPAQEAVLLMRRRFLFDA